MRIVQGPGQARGAEALLSARGARREARLSASARLGQPWRRGGVSSAATPVAGPPWRGPSPVQGPFPASVPATQRRPGALCPKTMRLVAACCGLLRFMVTIAANCGFCG